MVSAINQKVGGLKCTLNPQDHLFPCPQIYGDLLEGPVVYYTPLPSFDEYVFCTPILVRGTVFRYI